MKKVSKTRSSKQKIEKESIREGEGKFNFSNGDSYEGEYVVINGREIYRHGFGVYKTSDGDEYQGTWDKDSIISNFHVTYNNKAGYEGELDEDGAMNGKGTYIFPDGTALTASWENNQPISDYMYKDPLGYKWKGNLSIHKQEVIFSPENCIWEK